MGRIYYYKLTTDDGGAPCVHGGLLSLAICKPRIRTTAEPGDLIFGFAADSLDPENRLLYVARVTDKSRGGRYYQDSRFGGRSDRIYALRNGHFVWRPRALHHSQDDVTHDLGSYPGYLRAQVLLSRDFRYLGARGTAAYKSKFPLISQAIERLGRGHRVHHPDGLRAELLALKDEVWRSSTRKTLGSPMDAPNCTVCHRSRSFGVLQSKGC